MTALLPIARQPRLRGQCVLVPRPCPFDRCRHHLGAVRAGESCSLDVADRGEHSLREVGEFLGVSHARVEQIEVMALDKVRKRIRRGPKRGVS
ncbi:MAG TPA: sigma factor-like helix-turn-helix DNA-binding protein [Polyangiaceae bacterium]|jgi:hypothetical protein